MEGENDVQYFFVSNRSPWIIFKTKKSFFKKDLSRGDKRQKKFIIDSNDVITINDTDLWDYGD